LENNKTASNDISAIVKSLSTRTTIDKNGNIVPISANDLLNGSIITYMINLNINEYDEDGIDGIVTSNIILNQERASYLSTLYTSWEVSDDKIQVKHYVLEGRNNMDSLILRKIINDGYLDKVNFQDFINENVENNEYKKYSIDYLLDNGIIKTQDSKYIIN
jgi:hypothetical protein